MAIAAAYLQRQLPSRILGLRYYRSFIPITVRLAGSRSITAWEATLSRIWEALRLAERQRTGVEQPSSKNSVAFGNPERRGTIRDSHRVPLLVYGSDGDKQPFHEEVLTINVSENGCLIAIESSVSRGQRLFLTNTSNQAEQECQVIHVGRRSRGKLIIGVAFLHPAPNFWRPR